MLIIPASARTLVASFLARAVADEIIPPSVLRNAAFLSLGGEVVKGARRLLSRCIVCAAVRCVPITGGAVFLFYSNRVRDRSPQLARIDSARQALSQLPLIAGRRVHWVCLTWSLFSFGPAPLRGAHAHSPLIIRLLNCVARVSFSCLGCSKYLSFLSGRAIVCYSLATRDHVLSRLEHVWGPGDGRPVGDLKVAIDQVGGKSRLRCLKAGEMLVIGPGNALWAPILYRLKKQLDTSHWGALKVRSAFREGGLFVLAECMVISRIVILSPTLCRYRLLVIPLTCSCWWSTFCLVSWTRPRRA